jgi:hypothetical protein
MSIKKTSIVLLSTLAVACASTGPEPSAPGPVAATCVAPGDDGSRAGYHSADGTKWLADCDTPLGREYWRVFRSADSTAYLIPRPDGNVSVAKLCASPDPAVRSAAERATLCSEMPSIERLNALTPGDALAIARGLHRNLRFEAEGKQVVPFAIPSDLADACRAERPSDLKTVCERAIQPGNAELHKELTEAEANHVAEMLNRLYGIS